MSLSDLFKGLLFMHGYVNIADPDAVAQLAERPRAGPAATPTLPPASGAPTGEPTGHGLTCPAT